jgi:hydroxyacylglutathione hydrolase
LATPCHTKDSISYYVTDSSDPSQPGVVFTGDTLFIAGTGRFFEGTGAEMHAALSYLATLPDNTVVYNGHEYTAGNLAFAKFVDPENSALHRLETIVNENKITTGLSTIGDEKEWNVFMRLHSDAIRYVWYSYFVVKRQGPSLDDPTIIRKATGKSSDPSVIIDALRKLKNDRKE